MDENTRSEYISRTYPNVVNPTLSEFDEKMIMSIQKIRAKYAESKRSFTILVSDDTGYRLQTNTETLVPIPQPIISIVTSSTCQAIKMDGCVCNAKLKNGNEFCGRHTKKV